MLPQSCETPTTGLAKAALLIDALKGHQNATTYLQNAMSEALKKDTRIIFNPAGIQGLEGLADYAARNGGVHAVVNYVAMRHLEVDVTVLDGAVVRHTYSNIGVPVANITAIL
ncbi:MAG: hypothetical protein V4621_08230 [Pseudomonadota bacterium]